MRVVFAILVAANLAFLAWASWIDSPREAAPRNSVTSRLPRLLLADETGNGASGERNPQKARNGLERTAFAGGQCVTVGPFSTLALSARAASLLREQGFEPRQRTAEGERLDGYWVYIGGLESEADKIRVLERLAVNGIRDAYGMPESRNGGRVSVGVFTERAGAESRAEAVQKIGYVPQIAERRQAGTLYWVDVGLTASNRTVPMQGLRELEANGASIELRQCPNNLAAPAETPAPAVAGEFGPPRSG